MVREPFTKIFQSNHYPGLILKGQPKIQQLGLSKIALQFIVIRCSLEENIYQHACKLS